MWMLHRRYVLKLYYIRANVHCLLVVLISPPWILAPVYSQDRRNLCLISDYVHRILSKHSAGHGLFHNGRSRIPGGANNIRYAVSTLPNILFSTNCILSFWSPIVRYYFDPLIIFAADFKEIWINLALRQEFFLVTINSG